ncbi:hypothetical protein NDU88_005776 [Pleurodeles waltl]|uniref:Uncharacterized protein n=1 Tax=Pleurodeles waltl TaxID=8319 RepID=A0AAV7WVN1_PLEWA|nr:hypothetical protein NDU88_005776 [Pleurodeles waltl]
MPCPITTHYWAAPGLQNARASPLLLPSLRGSPRGFPSQAAPATLPSARPDARATRLLPRPSSESTHLFSSRRTLPLRPRRPRPGAPGAQPRELLAPPNPGGLPLSAAPTPVALWDPFHR